MAEIMVFWNYMAEIMVFWNFWKNIWLKLWFFGIKATTLCFRSFPTSDTVI